MSRASRETVIARTLCRYGSACKYGSRCRFGHNTTTDVEANHTQSESVCRYFQSGHCVYGNGCRFLHSTTIQQQPEAESEDVTDNQESHLFTSANKECGICITPAENVLYGLLSHCNCKFCLECIRGWRKEGINVSHSSEQVRKCPLCRIESHFVVPSKEFLVGDAKKSFIDAYKANLAAKPCKVRTRLLLSNM